jgi:hypothetical protein
MVPLPELLSECSLTKILGNAKGGKTKVDKPQMPIKGNHKGNVHRPG